MEQQQSQLEQQQRQAETFQALTRDLGRVSVAQANAEKAAAARFQVMGPVFGD